MLMVDVCANRAYTIGTEYMVLISFHKILLLVHKSKTKISLHQFLGEIFLKKVMGHLQNPVFEKSQFYAVG
jgi:hypothetical protein